MQVVVNHKLADYTIPILVDAIYWNAERLEGPLPAWFSPALNKGPTEDGGGLMRMGNDVHLFPVGQPAEPTTCLTVKPGSSAYSPNGKDPPATRSAGLSSTSPRRRS